MTGEKNEVIMVERVQIFDCESVPIPPGTKSRQRLARGLEDESAPSQRTWLTLASLSLISLLVGIVIGRFLLP